MARVVLIVNPFASGVDERRIELVQAALARRAEVQTEVTQRRGHATEFAREAADHADAIFVFSGDGGFNEVANGLGEGAPPIGCIPGGGTSVFPRALGIPRDPVRAAERLAEALERGRTRRIGVGRVNGRRFLFNSGIRFDAELVRRIERKRAGAGGRPGDFAFAATMAGLIAEHRGRFDPTLELDGLGRAAFVLVANTDPYTYLGAIPLHAAPRASFEGGLDAIAPVRVRPWTIPRLLRYVLTGRGQLNDPLILSVHDVDQLQVRCDLPLPLQADGEDLGDVKDVRFEAERQAINVLT